MRTYMKMRDILNSPITLKHCNPEKENESCVTSTGEHGYIVFRAVGVAFLFMMARDLPETDLEVYGDEKT